MAASPFLVGLFREFLAPAFCHRVSLSPRRPKRHSFVPYNTNGHVTLLFSQLCCARRLGGGFALGLGLTVIPTCRADQIGKLHFDVRHLNTLPWSTPEDLAVNLGKRIVAILGTRPFVKT